MSRRWVAAATLALAALGCARRGPPEPTGLPGEQAADGPVELTLAYRPPAGARVACPALVETLVSAVGPDRPLQQTLGGDRVDLEEVTGVEGATRAVRLTFGETKWNTSFPLPAPQVRDLPPTTLVGRFDEAGKLLDGTPDGSVTQSMAGWVRQFDAVPGWPARPLRRGETLPRPLRGPGPPGTGSTVEAAAPLTLTGYARVAGRLCARFRSDVRGHLVYVPPEAREAETARSVLRGTSWLYFDVETGMRLGSLHTLHYALPLPGAKPGPVPEFRATFRSGPCRYEAP
ncbi:MAG: hypothetical protein JXB32_25175 [Deltaproteobacteria bacterium]|nr:hypothetical protein [Deltaproteobacteria bacterium]